MANVLDIRRRIRSVRNTRQITKAMKMVSAARLRRTQERALSARPYAQMLVNVLRSLVSRVEIYDPETGEPRHPMLIRREEKNALVILISGEKGFAGAFNANIFKAVQRFLDSRPDENIDLLLVGRKGRDYFRRRYPYAPGMSGGEAPAEEQQRAGRIQITGEHMNVLNKADFSLARELAEYAIDRYLVGEIDAVYLVFNEFKSVIAQRVIVDEILPIKKIGERDVQQADEMTEADRKRAIEAAKTAGVSPRHPDTREVDAAAAQFGTQDVDYIYEQPASALLSALIPRYVSTLLFQAMLESVAAEHAARMTAMDSATNNASDMIDSLTLSMNRARQAAITKEIIEIVSGAAAL